MPEDRDDLAELLVHELRGPLTVISRLRRDPQATAVRRRALRAIAAIERAVYRADAILEDFLAGRLGESRFSTPTASRSPLVAEHVAAEETAATGREVRVERPARPRSSATSSSSSGLWRTC